MSGRRFYVLGPLMGGYGSKAFLGQELSPSGRLRPAVLIFLPGKLVEDSQLFEKICQETNVAVKLDHLNIITILGLVKLDEGYARVVEFADGESLRSLFARARELGLKIPAPVAAAIVADACAGVHHAHQEGNPESGRPLLHLAVRPETILVTFRGIGMVTGYGFGAIMERMLSDRGKKAKGGDAYMAPELIAGGRRAATVQTDVFGLGATLLEALTGKPPAMFGQAHAEGLLGIAYRAMSPEPGIRFATTLEMREALLQEEVATKHQVAAFMQEVFPEDLPQIKGRRDMLKRGQMEHDADPPELSGEGPPESVDLVWRYPIREISGDQAPAPAAKPKPPPKPAAQSSSPGSAGEPETKPEPAAQSSSPGSAGEPEPKPAPKPEPAPAPRRPAPAPPPPYPERKARRRSPLVVPLVVLLVAGAFGLGLVFSDWGEEETPEPPVVPAATTPPDQKPQASTKPAPPKAKRPKKSGKTKKKRRTKARRSGRGKDTGYLNVKAPRGSKVYIRGRFVGRAPLRKYKLPAGRHKVMVVKKGGGSKYKRVVPISAGREMTLTVEFY